MRVAPEKVAEFAVATGFPGAGVPPTYPILMLNQAMLVMLADAGLELSRIVHGEQKFHYERPVRVGEDLSADLEVVSVRALGQAQVIGTRTQIHDSDQALVCTAHATLVHQGAA